MCGMTAIYSAPEAGWIPDNDLGDRLAQVRSRMGWNYTEAGDACGIDGEAWARWELEGSRPQHFEAVCRTISSVTKCDIVWLSTGRSSSDVPPPQRMKRRARRIGLVLRPPTPGEAPKIRKLGLSTDARRLAAETPEGREISALYTAGDLNPEPADISPPGDWIDELAVRRARRQGVRRAPKPSIVPSVMPPAPGVAPLKIA